MLRQFNKSCVGYNTNQKNIRSNLFYSEITEIIKKLVLNVKSIRLLSTKSCHEEGRNQGLRLLSDMLEMIYRSAISEFNVSYHPDRIRKLF
jgi:hypothetical protein